MDHVYGNSSNDVPWTKLFFLTNKTRKDRAEIVPVRDDRRLRGGRRCWHFFRLGDKDKQYMTSSNCTLWSWGWWRVYWTKWGEWCLFTTLHSKIMCLCSSANHFHLIGIMSPSLALWPEPGAANDGQKTCRPAFYFLLRRHQVYISVWRLRRLIMEDQSRI